MSGALDRRRVVARLLAERGEALVIAGLGSPAWDAAAAGDHALTFPLWGAMGGAVPMALGLALARPERRVIALTGDGEMLMGLGALATVAAAAPANLAVVVLDNERYGETGGQQSHTARGVELAAVARAAGFAAAETLAAEADLAAAIATVLGAPGPVMAVFKIAPGTAPPALPPRDGTWLKHRFRQALLGRIEG